MEEERFVLSADGVNQVRFVVWTPTSKEQVAVVQILHGMAEHVLRYRELAEYLCSCGFVVVAGDMMGHGKSMCKGKNPGYIGKKGRTILLENVKTLHQQMQQEYQGLPYFFLGHSMGSFLLRNYLAVAEKEDQIQGAILSGTGEQGSLLVGFGKAIAGLCNVIAPNVPNRMLNALSFGGYCQRIPQAETTFDWLSVRRDNVTAYIQDPLCGYLFTSNGFYVLLDLIANAGKKNTYEQTDPACPLLLLSGTEDPVGMYGKGPLLVEKKYRKYCQKDISVKLYEGCRHEILQETQRESIYREIGDWIALRIIPFK